MRAEDAFEPDESFFRHLVEGLPVMFLAVDRIIAASGLPLQRNAL